MTLPPPALYAHELHQSRRTKQQRTIWLEQDQTKIVVRARNHEVIIAVWNKDKPLRSSTLMQIQVAANIPASAVRIDDTRDNWYGSIYRWIGAQQ